MTAAHKIFQRKKKKKKDGELRRGRKKFFRGKQKRRNPRFAEARTRVPLKISSPPFENGGYCPPASRLTAPFRRSLPCGFLLGFIAPFFRRGGLMCPATGRAGAVNNPYFQTGAGILRYTLFRL